MRIGEALVCGHVEMCSKNDSKSSTVTRPPAPLPGIADISAARNPSSAIRARIRGEM